MPQWAGSCWYYLRFADPDNDRAFVGSERERQWLPVDVYIGGAEHAVLHLLYARFWHKVLYDLGLVHTKEPFQRLVNQGMIRSPSYRASENAPYLTADEVEIREGSAYVKATGEPAYSVMEKMSKSKKNVVNPDELIQEYGADTLRLYIMFMGPPSADRIWSRSDIEGIWRFLNRAWRLLVGDERFEPAPRTDEEPEGEDQRALHRAIAGVTADMESLAYNTAISKLMVLLNQMTDRGAESRPLPRAMAEAFLRMLEPFAPHIAEEMWARVGGSGLICRTPWPEHDPAHLVETEVELAVQVNGKVRDRLRVPADAEEAEVLRRARELPKVQAHLEGRTISKQMVVPGRLVVLVVR